MGHALLQPLLLDPREWWSVSSVFVENPRELVGGTSLIVPSSRSQDKMLESMVLTRDAEDTEVMRHRFEGFEQEMNGSASRVAVVNQLARQLLHVEHPNSEQVLEKQNALNQSWAALRDAAEKKRENISSAHGVQTFHVECRETIVSRASRHRGGTPSFGNGRHSCRDAGCCCCDMGPFHCGTAHLVCYVGHTRGDGGRTCRDMGRSRRDA